MCKIHGLQSVKMGWNIYNINDVYFLLVMSSYEVHAIYILTKFVQLS